MSPANLNIVTLTDEQLVTLIETAVAKAFDRQRAVAASDAQTLSASQATRLAKCRRGDVCHALAAGALKGKLIGRRWSTTVAAVKAWVATGRPIVVEQ